MPFLWAILRIRMRKWRCTDLHPGCFAWAKKQITVSTERGVGKALEWSGHADDETEIPVHMII